VSVLQRLRSPGSRAVRDAGPADRSIILALIGGGVIDSMLAASRSPVPSWFYFVPPALLTLMVSLTDRRAWLIRSALANIALTQRARLTARGMPTTPAEANAWIANPPSSATDFDRAAILFTLQRFDEARVALDAVDAADPGVRLAVMRLGQALASATNPSIRIDVDAIEAAARELPPEERRYQVLAATWTRAFLDIKARRPWAPAFLSVVRRYRPYPVPIRYKVLIALQQLAAPIACVIAGILVVVVAAVWT
jgi:hypothetical protein